MTIDVLTSGIWQTTSTIVASGGRCLVIDPAYFPRELEAIAARARERGHVEAVVFTHGHWDHVMGHHALPGAPVWLSSTLERSITGNDPRAAKYLDDARDFDSRWYVPRPHGHTWPTSRRGLDDGERIEVGGLVVEILQLAGHSPDGLAVVADGTLVCGDHLSPCEIPFVDDAPAYRATLARLIDRLPDLREVIPGHGPRMSAGDALAIARADLAYLDGLLAAAAANDRDAALALPWPRATDVVGMRDHHLENLAAVGL
jgi:hydroxyacylglutathione hydrolase